MMITLQEALKIGKAYFQKHEEHIVQINEAEDCFIIFGANEKEDIKYGRTDIKINKNNGEIEMFVLPSIKNFKLLEKSVKIEFDKE